MSVENTRQPENRPSKRRRRSPRYNPLAIFGKFFAVIVMVGIITGCIVASVLTVYVLNTLDSSDRVELDNVKMSFTTILYAKKENSDEYFELQRVQNNENRIWVDYSDIPQSLKDAAVAVEDKRFWSHSGIDFKRTLAAVINYANPFAQDMFGGSTITQQVIKNVTNDNEFDVGRKVREIFRAINLEKNYSKEQILEVYLNTIALGNGQNGVQSASNLYFGKNVSELTPAESASLIAITQNPTKWNPFSNPEDNRARQLMILGMMHEQSHPDGTPLLTDEEYEAAISQEMMFKKDEYVQKLDTVQNWFIDTVYEEVRKDLVEKAGYTESGAREAVRTGGFRIYTTVDAEMQDYLEEKYLNPDTFPTIRNKEYPESAFVILDFNGQIKAIVGSNREKSGALVFNRATSAVRHPGSTIKPIASYALALEYNMINWSMVWEDSPILLDPEDPNSIYPKNFYNAYKGPITITEAIQRSTNTIPVKLVQMLSPRTSFNFLCDSLGFKNLVESEAKNGKVYTDVALAPMALGGLTKGVTPLEMAGSYQIFGNGGLYTPPHSYTKVIDSEGNIILENKAVPKRVISQETATIMNKLLQRVTSAAPGTATNARFPNSSMPIAGKTGTSDNDYNEWFIGVTPYYVGVCYLGYDEMETINYSGYYYPPPLIYRNVMAPIHANLPVIDFPVSPNVIERTYCTESGLLASEKCTNTAMGWYKIDAMPEVCDIHDEEEVDDDDIERFDPNSDMSYWDWLSSRYPTEE
ncbi:transglycosylase domain-containing protein [Oscillospiraceae bacterium LTW-04]|nr:transglycosylase domain-containing protein [Oscillospiraceae bacterium MB24-C1]